MENLTPKEEEIMQILWKLKKAFVKDIIEELSNPDQPYTTIASVVRILEGKGYVKHISYGRMHEYHPLVPKSEYRQMKFKNLISQYFDSSIESVVSFLAKEENISSGEMEKIVKEVYSKSSARDKNVDK